VTRLLHPDEKLPPSSHRHCSQHRASGASFSNVDRWIDAYKPLLSIVLAYSIFSAAIVFEAPDVICAILSFALVIAIIAVLHKFIGPVPWLDDFG